MEYKTAENTKTFEYLDKLLGEGIDKEITKGLEELLEIVKQKSRALSQSLKRCFNNAKNSLRFVIVYNLGKENAKKNIIIKEEDLEKYLEENLKDYFEKNDFMHYREFVRLNRACAIEVGIEVSSKIKDMYNEYFFKKRLITSYKLGAES